MNKPILGIIGGGQLGSLLSVAAKKLGIKTIILSDDPDAPAQHFADVFICGNYHDKKNINDFTKLVDIVTYEFENIPFEILDSIHKTKNILPKPEINKLIQNRISEKKFLNSNKIQTTKYSLIKDKNDIIENKNLLPGLLKTTTLGYDGKGQFKINNIDEIDDNIDFSKEYILEKFVDLHKEISLVITRFDKNQYEIYNPIENIHENQILKYSTIPANISEDIKKQAIKWAEYIAEKLNYIGTLCVEYFIDTNNNLYANEIAPRVHNSGHLTINAYNISQFENHIRAVCNFKKIETKQLYNARMINLIGEDILEYRNKKLDKNVFFYDYLKKEIKNKRKMGHVTIIE
jgi:5-(carboxyamino)imidazole ribonucleotide synthase|tara:strand:- start:182 stop:1222 length:1041 start_codon:yes stop_codon:yes gene_type:complete